MNAARTFPLETDWIRVSYPHGMKGSEWVHSSGWSIHHCGHPTANCPYMLLHPDFNRTIVSHNGLGFCSTRIAKDVVERLVRGDLRLTLSNCVPGVARVNCTAFGERVDL